MCQYEVKGSAYDGPNQELFQSVHVKKTLVLICLVGDAGLGRPTSYSRVIFRPNDFNDLKNLACQSLSNVAKIRKHFATYLHAALPLLSSLFPGSLSFQSNRVISFPIIEFFSTQRL